MSTTCGTCHPETGDRNTICAACLMAELNHERPTAITPASVIDHIVSEAIPARYRHVTSTDLVAELVNIFPAYQNVYLTGPSGRGKTHQAIAIMRREIERQAHQGRRITAADFQFVNTAQLVERLRSDQRREHGIASLVTQLANAHILVLDDLGAEKPTEWVRERIYDLINQRYENERGTVITSNLTPSQLAKQLGDRIAGRLMEGAAYIKVDGQQRRRPAQHDTGAAAS